MNKCIVVCTYNGILLSQEKGMGYKLDEPWKHSATWKKLGVQSHIPYDSTYTKCPQKENPERQNRHEWLQGTGEGKSCRWWLKWVRSVFLGWWKGFETGEKWWSCNIADTLNATGLYTLKQLITCCVSPTSIFKRIQQFLGIQQKCPNLHVPDHYSNGRKREKLEIATCPSFRDSMHKIKSSVVWNEW